MQRRQLVGAATAAALSLPRWRLPPGRPTARSRSSSPGPAGGGMDMLARTFLPFVAAPPARRELRRHQPPQPPAASRPSRASRRRRRTASPSARRRRPTPSPCRSSGRCATACRTSPSSATSSRTPAASGSGPTARSAASRTSSRPRAQRPGQITIGTAGVGSDDHLLHPRAAGGDGHRILACALQRHAADHHQPAVPQHRRRLLQHERGAGPDARRRAARAGAGRAGALGRRRRGADLPRAGLRRRAGSTRGLVAPPNLPAEIREPLRAAVAGRECRPGLDRRGRAPQPARCAR